jgi:hypothetical protein
MLGALAFGRAVLYLLFVVRFSLYERKSNNCSGRIDVAHFQPASAQPTEVGFVAQAEAFRPAGGGQRMSSPLFNHNRKIEQQMK